MQDNRAEFSAGIVQRDESQLLVTGRSPLEVGNASAAILVLQDGRYVLQLRDDKESIWYPGHWGCFGGATEPDEDPVSALHRELREELAVKVQAPEFFIEIDFDLPGLGLGRYFRKYYVVQIHEDEMASFRLGEGRAIAAHDADAVLGTLKLVPYDAFALFLHARAYRFGSKYPLHGIAR